MTGSSNVRPELQRWQTSWEVNKMDSWKDAKRSHNGLYYLTENANAMFSCPRCKAVNPGMPGERQGCPTCHKPTNQTVVLARDWEIMSPDQREYLKSTWEA